MASRTRSIRVVQWTKDLYALPPEELAKVPQVCGSLREALDSLKADHEFLKKGNVFSPGLHRQLHRAQIRRSVCLRAHAASDRVQDVLFGLIFQTCGGKGRGASRALFFLACRSFGLIATWADMTGSPDRQGHEHRTTLVQFAFHPGAPAMQIGQGHAPALAPAPCHPPGGPKRLSTWLKGMKMFSNLSCGTPGPLSRTMIWKIAIRPTPAGSLRCVRHTGCEFHGVGNQVEQDLLQRPLVGIKRRRGLIDLDHQRLILLARLGADQLQRRYRTRVRRLADVARSPCAPPRSWRHRVDRCINDRRCAPDEWISPA